MAQISEQTDIGQNTDGYQLWKNPVDSIVYAGRGQPNYGFNSSDDYFFPVFDPASWKSNVEKLVEAKANGNLTQNLVDSMSSPYLDEEFGDAIIENKARVASGNRRVREAALISPTNSTTNILNVFGKTFGLKDRKYAGTELAQAIAVPNLVIDIDVLTKFGGMSEIGEMQLPRGKEVKYTRTHYETKKYGLMFETSEESILKNVHNPFQDSVTVAGTKVLQRKAYDVVSTLDAGLTGIAALAAWDTYVASTDRSTQNALKDISRVVNSTIEGTGEGGTFNRAGIHTISKQDYDTNSYLRGIVEPAPPVGLQAGVTGLKGFAGVGVVQDQFIPQGTMYVVDVGDETCAALFEGPERVATKVDEMLNSRVYGIFSYHLAAIINASKGRKITSIVTPVAPA